MNFLKKKVSIPFLILLSYTLLNYIFNFNIWHYSIFKVPNTLVVFGEWPVYEYVAETVRLNILSLRNPFNEAPLLFPFGWNFALEDVAPINGVYFLFLRPFFSVHDAFTIIVMFGIVASCAFMYLLLRQFEIRRGISYVLSLVYGYSPFVVARLGHPTYTALYLFPAIAFFFISVLRSKTKKFIVINSFGLTISVAVLVLTNLYFTVMLALMVSFFLSYYLISNKNVLTSFIKSRYQYLLIILFLGLILLYPWIIKVYRSLLLSQGIDFHFSKDSIQFSSDLIGIFTPATTGLVFGKFLEYMSSILALRPAFENLVYPGIIILLGVLYVIFFNKKISLKIKRKINPMLFVILCFWILTLGPKLHIFGHETFIVLPFKILNSIPYVQLARSPARFIVPAIFLMTIVTALLAQDFADKKVKDRLTYFTLCILAIFIFLIDQSYTASFGQVLQPIPQKIYDRLESSPTGPVMEIPFVIRDGLQYIGDFNAVSSLRTQLIYKKPKFSVYAGRLNPAVFDYYRNDAFIGYLAQLIDPSSQSNLTLDRDKMLDSIEFFGLENIVLKQKEPYSEAINDILISLGYELSINDNGYSLYNRMIKRQEFYLDELSSSQRQFYFGYGWAPYEPEGRWTLDKVATIFFKTNRKAGINLDFEANTIVDNQQATININGLPTYNLNFDKERKKYHFSLQQNLKVGVNRITFIFEKNVRPSNIYKDNQDNRNLAVFFSKLSIKK